MKRENNLNHQNQEENAQLKSSKSLVDKDMIHVLDLVNVLIVVVKEKDVDIHAQTQMKDVHIVMIKIDMIVIVQDIIDREITDLIVIVMIVITKEDIANDCLISNIIN